MYIWLERRGAIARHTADAEACIGHVRKTVSLMEVLRLQAQTPLPAAGCFLPSA
jgi:hypothetical protein